MHNCSIDHDALLLANKGKFEILSCPDCKAVIERNPDILQARLAIQREQAMNEITRQYYTGLRNQNQNRYYDEVVRMSDEELAEIHASMMNGNYVKTRS